MFAPKFYGCVGRTCHASMLARSGRSREQRDLSPSLVLVLVVASKVQKVIAGPFGEPAARASPAHGAGAQPRYPGWQWFTLEATRSVGSKPPEGHLRFSRGWAGLLSKIASKVVSRPRLWQNQGEHVLSLALSCVSGERLLRSRPCRVHGPPHSIGLCTVPSRMDHGHLCEP